MLVSEMTMPAFSQKIKDTPLAILPLGVVEQHGPHLPLGLDAMHALALAQKAAEKQPALVAPPLWYGMCRSTGQHPGTLGISGPVLRGFIKDLGLALAGQGVRGLCLLSGHAGGTHNAALVEAGEELLLSTDLEVAAVCVLDLLEGARAFLECGGDSHAGEVETSLALYLWPGLVHGQAAEAYPSFPQHILVRDKRSHWPTGVWGDPGKASADKGKRVLEAEALALAGILQDLAARAPA